MIAESPQETVVANTGPASPHPAMFLVTNEARSTVLADKARQARGLIERGRGLMLSPELPEGGALIIEPCNSIHMFFMRYPLDIIFTDGTGIVLFMYRGIKPWRMGRFVKGARLAIELPLGTIERTGTEVGDRLHW